MTRLRRTMALITTVAMVMVLVACSSGSSGTKRVAGTDNSAARTGARLADLLATAGIGTVAHPGADPVHEVTGTLGITFTQWQVDSMARQVEAGQGYRGTDLNALVADSGAKIPIAAVLAGWLEAADTPASDAARRLTGDRDWRHQALRLTYSDAVLALFVADLARDAGGAPGTMAEPAVFVGGAGEALRVLPAAEGACTQLQNLLTGTFDSIVSQLKINATSGVGGVLATIWNTVVEIAAGAAKVALGALTAPVMAVVRNAAVVLGLLSSVSSLLDPWDQIITGDPAVSHFGVEPAAAPSVEVTARVLSEANFSWPADVTSCAAVAGVTLSDPTQTAGSEISWTVDADQQIAQVQDMDKVVGPDGTAKLTFTTGTEQAKDHDKGAEHTGIVSVSTLVKRSQVKDLLKLVDGLFIEQLPGPVAALVDPLLGPVRAEARARLEKLSQSEGKAATMLVDHHGPAVEDPPPAYTPPTPACDPQTLTRMPPGVWEGPLSLRVLGQGGGIKGAAVSKGSGTMSMTIEANAVKKGKWKVGWRSRGVGTGDGTGVKLELVGSVGGSVSGSAKAPTAQGEWRIRGVAQVFAPVRADLPIDESGGTSNKLTLEEIGCDTVTATFVPSFNTNAASGVTFTGTATWTGHRVG